MSTESLINLDTPAKAVDGSMGDFVKTAMTDRKAREKILSVGIVRIEKLKKSNISAGTPVSQEKVQRCVCPIISLISTKRSYTEEFLILPFGQQTD
jgi:ATP-dependent protease HslVU (ClpYQ) ATPase subunit